jgi:poly(3-hydroxybutyrate) depolymerase
MGGAGTGGAASGGAGTGAGGGTASGGANGSGGASGTGGRAGTGGATATGGAPGADGGTSTTGCGATTWPAGDQMYTLDVGGISRTYIVGLPSGYNASKPERLVFAFHGRTGTAMQIAGTGTRGYYGLRSMMPDTIFVAPQGLGTATDPADTGWPNTGGQDIAFVRAMIASLSARYCIDQGRIFSTGFSYGGIMSHTIACQMSDVFRAVAPMAGAMFGRPTCLTHPIAAWMTHGSMDTSASGGVDFSAGQTARDRIVTLNHCQTTTTTVGPDPMCVSYNGCDAGYPVNWCPHTGAHMIPSFAAAGISAFFMQF